MDASPAWRLPRLAVAIAWVGLSTSLAGATPPVPRPTDYATHLARLDQAIAATGNHPSPSSGSEVSTRVIATVPGPESPPSHPLITLRRLHLLHRRALLTCEPEDFRRVESAVDAASDLLGTFQDYLLLRARLRLNRHRTSEARSDLARLTDSNISSAARTLEADLCVMDGRVQEARRLYREIVSHRRTWDGLARLAYLERIYTGPREADHLYLLAEDEITAKDMQAFAWVEVQRGIVDIEQGKTRDALTHYRRAQSAYSGYWLVDEHLAEALAASGQYQEAIALYESLIRRSDRPELRQALGDLHRFLGDSRSAEPWHLEALKVYRESASGGEVHYLHHLATMLTDTIPNPSEAVRWATLDVSLRPNYATRDTLAWALFRSGDFTNALTEVRWALDSQARSVHLYAHASQIMLSFGRAQASTDLQNRAKQLHPGHQTTFHLHR